MPEGATPEGARPQRTESATAIAIVAVICAALALVVAAVALAVAINNDGGGRRGAPAAAPRVQDVGVSELEYAISPATATAPSGPVVFHVSNDGNATHEFMVLATDLPDGNLPRTPDGKVDVASPQLRVVGQVSGIVAGQGATLPAMLVPGHYVLICNVSGHYAAGMHTGFTAS